MIYAGIGSRKTPPATLTQMEIIGQELARRGHVLRSGSAIGADTAFGSGARAGGIRGELFTPYDAMKSGAAAWHTHAAMFHPAWNQLGSFAKCLHARNSAIMLGPQLDTPVSCVVCWTRRGEVTGGTGQALRIAEAYKIPVFNLFDPLAAARMWEWAIYHE